MKLIHIPWPSIKSFSHVHKNILNYPQLVPNGSVVQYRSKIKLDGTSCAIRTFIDNETNEIDLAIQTRERFATFENDNYGSARFILPNKDLWIKNHERLFKRTRSELILYGEICGMGVPSKTSLAKIEGRFFAIFAAQIRTFKTLTQDEIYMDNFITDPKALLGLMPKDFNKFGNYVLPWFDENLLTIDFLLEDEKLQEQMNQFNSIIQKIDEEDPWVKENFNITGPGEGLVFFPVSHTTKENFANLAFKVKGEKHKQVLTKEVIPVNIEKVKSIEEFVKLVVTESRLIQGSKEVGSSFDKKLVGKFIAWISKDVQKECGPEMENSGLEWKDCSKQVGDFARNWFLAKC